MSIIVYSDSELIIFSLQYSIGENTLTQNAAGAVGLILCKKLSDLEEVINKSNHPMVILDVDNIPRIDLYRLFHFANLKCGRILMFTKKNKFSNAYISMQNESPFIMSKEFSLDEINNIIFNFICNPSFFKKDNGKSHDSSSTSKEILTLREMKVCNYLLSGMSTKDIAILLDISIKTVYSHRLSIKTKYKSKSLVDLYMKINRT